MADVLGSLDFMPNASLLDVPWLHLIPIALRKNVRKLHLDNPLATATSPTLSSIFISLPRAPPTCYAPFTRLDLYKHKFGRFLEFQRLVSGLPNLERLGVYEVSWGDEHSPIQTSDRLRRPQRLSLVCISDLSKAWDLLRLTPLDFESHASLERPMQEILKRVYTLEGNVAGSVMLTHIVKQEESGSSCTRE